MISEYKCMRRLLTPSIGTNSAMIVAIGIAIRIPFDLIPPASGLYNSDELFPAYEVVDRWMGLPPVTLSWPDMPAVFATFLIFLPKFLWALLTDRSLDRLSSTIAFYYHDPSMLIMTLRLISSLSGALAAATAYQLVRRIGKSESMALAAAVIVTFLPLSLSSSLVGVGDAVALMFAMWVAYGLFCNPVRPVLVGLATAAVAATKTALGIWLLPVFIGGAVVLYQREGAKGLGAAIVRCASFGVLGIALLSPYLWLEPVRSLRAVLAAALVHANSVVPDASIFSVAISGRILIAAMIVAALLGIGTAFANAHWRYAAIAVGLPLSALLAFFLKIGFDYWRYFLGALVPAIVLWSFASQWAYRNVMAMAVAAVITLFGAEVLKDEVQSRLSNINQRSLFLSVEQMCQRGDTIWMYDGVLANHYFSLPMPKAAISEVTSYLARADRSNAVVEWLVAAKVSPVAAVALQTDFDEKDQLELARWRAMGASSQVTLNCPFHFFRYQPHEDGSPAQTGYARGTFTDKSLSDVRTNLDHPGDAMSIDVIGPSDALLRLRVPSRPVGNGLSVGNERTISEREPR